MENPSHKDWHLLNRAVEKLNSDFDPRSLPQRALESVAELVPGGVHSFDFFSRNEKYNRTAWHNGGDLVSPEKMEVFVRYVHEHPLIPVSLADPSRGALKISDVVTQREFERTGLFKEFYSRLGVRYQIGMSLPVADDLTICCVVTRDGKDFSERDKTALNLAGPHLINAIRNALAYERVSAALESGGAGIIALDSANRLVYASEFARTLCERYFAGEKLEASSLPETLDRWIRQTDADAADRVGKFPKPLRIENHHGVLHIRLMDNGSTREKTILFEEKSFYSAKLFERLPLTPRETEILFWITQGKADAAVALLCGISRRTVEKHVENIYTKLGVETRTAAMLRAFEVI